MKLKEINTTIEQKELKTFQKIRNQSKCGNRIKIPKQIFKNVEDILFNKLRLGLVQYLNMIYKNTYLEK